MISYSVRNDIITHLLRTGSWTKPTVWALALFTTTPAADGTGGVEVSGVDYARRAVLEPLDTVWASPVNGETWNLIDVEFNSPGSDWGSITAVCIMNTAALGTGGPRFIHELPNPLAAPMGDTPILFPATTIRFSLD